MDVAVNAVVLVSIIASGYLAKRLGWLAASDFKPLSTIVLRVTLPCALAVAFDTVTFTPGLALLPLVGLGINAALLAVGFGLGRRTGSPAFGVLNVSSLNIGLFAMPWIATFLGPSALVYAALIDVGNVVAAAGIAYGWGLALARGDQVTVSRVLLTALRSPLLVPYAVLVGLRLAGLHLPGPVLAFAGTVASANTFLAMFLIGVGLQVVLPREQVRTAATLLLGRYAVAVAVAIGFWFVPGLDPVLTAVGCMVAFAPIAVMMTAFTGEAGLDVPTSAFMASVSILIGIVAMPAVLAVVPALG